MQQYLTPAQVATALGMHVRTVHRKLKATPPELPGKLYGRNWRIPVDAIQHSGIPNTVPANVRRKAQQMHGIPVQLPDGYAIMNANGQMIAQQKREGGD